MADCVPGMIDGFFEPDAGLGCPICVAVATLKPDKWGRRRVASGRGYTREEAASRCFSEAQERLAAVYDESLDIVHGAPAELGNASIDPKSLLLISETQYEHVSEWNDRVQPDHRLPARIDAQQKLAWVRVRSLVDGRSRLAPAAHCFLGYPFAIKEGFPIPDSNGLASGTSLADAIERAFLEVVERDAVSIWWYGRVNRPRIDPDAEEVLQWEPFEEWMRRSKRTVWLLDLTHDLAVPVVAAISCDESRSDLSFGFAAARSKAAAAQSAMGELVQFEVTKQIQSQSPRMAAADFLSWCMTAKLDDHRFILPDDAAESPKAVLPADKAIAELLTENRLEGFVLDLPCRSLNMKVVRVLVPGLRYIWPRFAPGRLYDIPHKSGWHARRLSEAELNPVHILY